MATDVVVTLGWKTVNPGQDYDDLETQAVDSKMQTLRPNVYVSRRDHEASCIAPTLGSPPYAHTNGDSGMNNDNNGNSNSNNYYEQHSSHQHHGLATEVELHQGRYTSEQDSEK